MKHAVDQNETESGLEWIYLAQDRDKNRAVVNTAMDLRVK